MTAGLLQLAACAEGPSSGATPTSPAVEPNLEELTEPEPDWDELIIYGVTSSEADARSNMVIEVLVPSLLDEPSRIVVTSSEAAPPEWRVTGLVYDDEKFGRYWLLERVKEMTQQELESWLDCDPAEGCQGSWSLVVLPGGIRGVLIEGPIATSLVWLDGERRFDVIGPADTFSGSSAIEVASKVASSSQLDSVGP